VTSEVRLEILRADELTPWVAQLRELERGITYPIEDGADAFTIDHGPSYHPFFSEMGDAFFMVARDEQRLLGSLAGVFRTARVSERELATVYFADLKLAPDVRGRGVVHQMARRVVRAALFERRFWRWRLAYYAAMQGEHGDVARTMSGPHAGRLLRRSARLSLYFVEPAVLSRLPVPTSPPPPSGGGLDLSPGAASRCSGAGWVTTAERKDLRIVSTGRAWPLVHLPLGPAAWGGSWGRYLSACGAELAGAGPAQACFAIDERLEDHVGWLAAAGVVPSTFCSVYALSILPGLQVASVPWIHLATSEI
jgi:hypothetical protein